MRLIPLISGVLLLASASCSDNRAQMPKPKAWPRIDMPAETWRDTTMAGVHLQLPGAPRVLTESKSGHQWLTLDYSPTLPADVYITLSTPGGSDSLATILANRRERMTLNSGDLPSKETTWSNPDGWKCLTLRTPGSVSTPVQFLSTDSRHVLSGAASLRFGGAVPPDSVKPIVDRLESDIFHLLNSLE